MGLFDTIASQAEGFAVGQLKAVVPPKIITGVTAGSNVLNQLASGNFLGAAATLANSFARQFGIGQDVATQLYFQNTPTPLFGGVTPAEAKQIYSAMAAMQIAKKNLFLVEVRDVDPQSTLFTTGPYAIYAPGNRAFNMFVTDLDYAPATISGDKHRIGSASMDSVGGFEPIEMRMTAIDDVIGTIKTWMQYKCSLVTNADGTVGVPFDYLLKIRVLHSFITDASNQGGYEDEYIMRPVSVSSSLSRREDAIQEVQLAFTQFDTFIS
ncbi:hypothetical protein QYH69_07770 [Paraburkholderia sp. SARCC-3016]|uniref:hypothetical protein n=1 Tax=Paraburkholderia sp. SARCC-3016 TaxID=3058611 RepID=UPI0028068140|nr:hypothetical protein [Paraburkholderia sp. SARCC-3016]MDQ7977143.1 hypothetical protein [Paraburkholderia sp. SARCC-3016]